MGIRHKLKANKAREVPRHWLFFDTETSPQPENDCIKQVFRLGVCIYWRRNYVDKEKAVKIHVFFSKDEFYDILEQYAQDKITLYAVAHNLQFDAMVLDVFGELAKRGWRCEKYIHDFKVDIWSVRHGKRHIVFLDSMNYFNSALKKLGEAVGLEKLEMPEGEDTEAWVTYCRRDVEILQRAFSVLCNLIKEHDFGKLGYTIASTSFNAYRHKFLSHDIYIHNDERVDALERQAYFGGRCECFYIGKKDDEVFYMLDVNSMYPAVMLNNRYPCKLRHFYNRPLHASILDFYTAKDCIADVMIETDKPYYPVRYNKMLIFPVGRFKTTLAGPELALARACGHIRYIFALAVYDTAPIFHDFVGHMYDLRLQYKAEGNIAFAEMVKIMLNSLYGKFGQHSKVYEFVKFSEERLNSKWLELDLASGEMREYRNIMGRVERCIGERMMEHTFTAISAFCTSYARLKLLDYIEQAGWENVYYVDTDSLIVNAQGYERLREDIDATELGKLKLVESGPLEIAAPKWYRIGEHSKSKGLTVKAVKLDANTYRDIRFSNLDSALRVGNVSEVIMTYREIRERFEYRKGIVTSSGRVIPLTLNDMITVHKKS